MGNMLLTLLLLLPLFLYKRWLLVYKIPLRLHIVLKISLRE
ncbi:hypothetical protein V6Z12_A09G174200 [Gossypium hirsutum]